VVAVIAINSNFIESYAVAGVPFSQGLEYIFVDCGATFPLQIFDDPDKFTLDRFISRIVPIPNNITAVWISITPKSQWHSIFAIICLIVD
jgi:hypothetical protein